MVVSSQMSSCWAALVGEAIDSYRGEIAGYTREAHLVRVVGGIGTKAIPSI